MEKKTWYELEEVGFSNSWCCCVILGKSLHLSEPVSFFVKYGDGFCLKKFTGLCIFEDYVDYGAEVFWTL